MKAHGLAAGINRRGFLKQVGVGSATLAAVSTLGAIPTRVWADEGGTGFTFAAQSQATIAGEVHRVNMSGNGRVGGNNVEGGGSFNHFKLTDGIPRPLVAAGKWRATRLVSFNPIGTYSVFRAGILTMEIELISEIPSESRTPATLEVVCDLAAGGLNTGKDEGFALTASGVSYEPFGVGITLFPRETDQGD